MSVSLGHCHCAGVDRVVLVEDGRVWSRAATWSSCRAGPQFKALLESAGTLESAEEEGTPGTPDGCHRARGEELNGEGAGGRRGGGEGEEGMRRG